MFLNPRDAVINSPLAGGGGLTPLPSRSVPQPRGRGTARPSCSE